MSWCWVCGRKRDTVSTLGHIMLLTKTRRYEGETDSWSCCLWKHTDIWGCLGHIFLFLYCIACFEGKWWFINNNNNYTKALFLHKPHPASLSNNLDKVNSNSCLSLDMTSLFQSNIKITQCSWTFICCKCQWAVITQLITPQPK